MKRRKFIKNSAGAAAAFTIVPSFVLGKNHLIRPFYLLILLNLNQFETVKLILLVNEYFF